MALLLGNFQKNINLSGAPQTVSFSPTASAEAIVLAICVLGSTARAGGAPAIGGTAFTQIQSASIASETNQEMWYFPDPTTAATQSIVVPNTGTPVTFHAYLASIIPATGNSVTLDASNIKNGSGANPTGSLTTLTDGAIVFSIIADGDANLATARSQTVILNTDHGQYTSDFNYSIKATAGALEHRWTIPSDDYALIIGAFKETTGTVDQTSYNVVSWIQDELFNY